MHRTYVSYGLFSVLFASFPFFLFFSPPFVCLFCCRSVVLLMWFLFAVHLVMKAFVFYTAYWAWMLRVCVFVYFIVHMCSHNISITWTFSFTVMPPANHKIMRMCYILVALLRIIQIGIIASCVCVQWVCRCVCVYFSLLYTAVYTHISFD